MPKPEYGEASNSVESGKVYGAVISQVVSMGHQEYNGRSNRKYYIAFTFDGQTRALNNFGVNAWTSKNKPPFVGLYEVFCAVEKRELTPKEAEQYNIFDILGKSVNLEFAENEKGYMNVAAVSPCETPITTDVPLLSFGIDDIGTDAMDALPNNVANLVAKSKEYVDKQYATPVQESVQTTVQDLEDAGIPIEEVKDAEVEEVDPSKVPF